ncbi:hypothetical protein AMD27_13700 [Acinetobacter sp. TGL-Y2]|uniref:beta-lactamase hydrolase domain-containing protein n=1 Tax=Acinetobacter sp. TGL-Y2 TaxID=1407071 RepID=UPI0007A65AC5|nr:sulfur transferase domain-containing protein [Acinetobacter sp. TGL-Y2]AMW79847.1 hypothetical protein AMD27_13700 [Acinetobacter sp. TGL-Y2]
MTKYFIRSIFLMALALTGSFSYASIDGLSKTLNTNVSVSGEMTTEKFKQLMKQGFKSVIVNRPDQEQGNLTTASELRSLAEKSQISLIYQPVISGQIRSSDVEEFAKYYNSLPKPILLVCKSGSRSTVLFNHAKSSGLLHE